MFLNILKPGPGLQQVDKTLPMAEGETGIERGSLIKDASGEYELMDAADAGSPTSPGEFAYISLQPQSDLVAGMAGDVGQGAVSASEGQPVLTGVAISPSLQIETDMYDSTADWAIGDFCSSGAAGKFTEHSDGETALAKVDKVPAARWVNNADAVTGWRTGAPKQVITLTTMYVPNLQTA